MHRLPSLLIPLAIAACSSPSRIWRSEEERARLRAAHVEAVERETVEARRTMLRRITSKEGPGAQIHVLVISGGGAYGAFGAGVLKGWGQAKGEDSRRPTFDIATGISVGSLLAPYAILGDEQAYTRLYEAFTHADEKWAVKRGSLLGTVLKERSSFLDVSALHDFLRREFDTPYLARMAEEHEKGKTCFIGATNLDFGFLRAWEIGSEAARAKSDSDRERIHRMFFASCAVPGAFPAEEVDGDLYGDGGVYSAMFLGRPSTWLELFRDAFPQGASDRKPPRVRIWVIVNNQLDIHDTTVTPTWSGVAARSLAVMSMASRIRSIEEYAATAELLRREGGLDCEFRYVAIPDDFDFPEATDAIFDRELMAALAERGLAMGADPASWKSEPPTPLGAWHRRGK